jgi:spore germination protein YaaH
MQKYFAKVMVSALAMGAFPFFALAATATTVASKTAASTPLYYGAWVPYWTSTAGEQQIALNLDSLHEVSPFSYEIVSGGAIKDDLGISKGLWTGWISAVQSGGVKVIPTIAWFDTDGIYNLLSSTTARQAEEDNVATLVKSNKFDGIDIDFESMSTSTRPYYSLFIKGLAQRLHPAGEKLTCTVVPREPASEVYVVIPKNLVYPEDYTVLNKYCDEVRLMAYDQETSDLKLNASKGGDGTLYAPTADPDWVTKVVKYAVQYISPKKIMLGIPTYGYEYEVSWDNNVTTYQRVRSWDFFDAMNRADSLDITPVRNNAGELSFTFTSSTYLSTSLALTSYVSSTQPAVLKTHNPNASTTFYASFPDATSELQKVALAKKYGLRGVMFFKMDGDIDPAIWNSLN